jgi:uncharacterized membrane protein
MRMIKTFNEFIKESLFQPCIICTDDIIIADKNYIKKQNGMICLSCDRENKLKKILN